VVALAGVNLILTDIASEKLIQISENLNSLYGIKCLSFKMDITSETELIFIHKLLKNMNIYINVLINNAAKNPKVESDENKLNNSFETLNLKELEEDISVGLTGSIICSKVFGSCMTSRRSGNIINVSSDLGVIK
jgi:short-subunit dehydrogenase